jgi:hypothetical protein
MFEDVRQSGLSFKKFARSGHCVKAHHKASKSKHVLTLLEKMKTGMVSLRKGGRNA